MFREFFMASIASIQIIFVEYCVCFNIVYSVTESVVQ